VDWHPWRGRCVRSCRAAGDSYTRAHCSGSSPVPIPDLLAYSWSSSSLSTACPRRISGAIPFIFRPSSAPHQRRHPYSAPVEMPSATTFFAAESGRISGQAAPSINAHLFSSRYSCLRPNVALTARDDTALAPGRPDAVKRLDPRGPRSGPLGQGAERSERHDPAREAGRIVSLHRRRTVREPAARQVRKQLACRGFAVRWKRLFGLFLVQVLDQRECRPTITRAAFSPHVRSDFRRSAYIRAFPSCKSRR
jgi:hypothetical protein